MNIKPLNSWLDDSKGPVIISGPCSAESEEQLMSTAEQLSKIEQVQIFRAGVWKPRTRPNGFEGVGEIGLSWLKKVKDNYNLRVTTEVANAGHVELALKNDIDVLWIGARTSASPFTVQEIARALKGVDIPVMIKNPINPDLGLWLGAIERIFESGITKLATIHRGFSFYEKSGYRNLPMWQLPMELKRIIPKLPIFCDPSHIGGDPNLIASISQKALNMDMSGLMIETHFNPIKALSDSHQQITPETLKTVIEELSIKQMDISGTIKPQLEDLRDQIDILDEQIFTSISKRMEIVEEIGIAKAEENITALQIERMDTVLRRCKELAGQLNLSEAFATNIFNLIHEESVRKQNIIMDKNQKIDE